MQLKNRSRSGSNMDLLLGGDADSHSSLDRVNSNR